MFPTIFSHTVSHHTLRARVSPIMLFLQAGLTLSPALYYALFLPLDVWTRFLFFVVLLPLSLYHRTLQDFTFYDGLPPRWHLSTIFFGIATLAVMAIVRAVMKVNIKVSFTILCSHHFCLHVWVTSIRSGFCLRRVQS